MLKPMRRPTTTFGHYASIYKPPRKHEALGAGYEALADLDYHQPRQTYSRYTLPNPQTASLHTLQNPLERHRSIPCLRDQEIFSSGSHNYNHECGLTNLGSAKENQSISNRNAEQCSLEEETQREVEGRIAATIKRNAQRTKKQVSWADQVTYSEDSSRTITQIGRQNRNNNACNCTQDDVPLQGQELITRALSEPATDKLRAMKEGRYYRYMDTNSQQCINDIPTDYCSQEDNIVYNFVANENEDCRYVAEIYKLFKLQYSNLT